MLILLGLLNSCLEGLGISLVVLFLYQAIGKGGEAGRSEGLIGEIFQMAVAHLGSNLLSIGAVVFLITASASLLRYGYSLLAEFIGQRISENIRAALHDQYLDVSYDYVRRQDPSFLLDVIEDESWVISEVIAHLLSSLNSLFIIVAFTVLLVATSWQFAAVAAAGSLLMTACVRLLGVLAERLSAQAIEVNNGLTKRTLTTLNCLRTIRGFGAEASQKRKFREDARRVRDTLVRVQGISELVGPVSEIGHIVQLCAFVFAASALGISVAGALAAVALLHRMRPQIQSLQHSWIELAGASAALSNIRRILDRSDKVYLPAGKRPFTRLAHEIRFHDVTLRYPGARRCALEKVSFALPAGRLMALVGPSGAGKSSIVNLLLRLYKPDSGAILVDGVPLFDIERESWLGKTAIAGQDVELTEGTIGENIAMSRPGASLAELEAAAAQAGLLEFIHQQPDSFGAPVGERGLSLSSGQRQRIGLARALLRDPQILILDEAMSGVDTILEDRIRANIEQRFNGRTVIFITHRLETVLDVDHIVCIDDGAVVEEGPPTELLSRQQGALRRFLQVASPEPMPAKLRACESP